VTSPLVSILVPVFKREDLLGPCVESALAQTVTDLEVIIVDNASPDGTWKVCRQLAEDDSRVRIFRNDENVGPVRNWKRCLDEARGEYGKLLFSDDLIAPDYLEKTLAFLEDPLVGFVYTMVEIGPEPNAETNTVSFKSAASSGVHPSSGFIEGHLLRRERLPVSPGAALFRLIDLRANLMLDSPGEADWMATGAGPDVLIYLQVAAQYPSIGFVAESLCFFRFHGNALTVAQDRGVATGYAQAFTWFASRHLLRWPRARSHGQWWLRTLKSGRRWVSPRRHFRRSGTTGTWLFWPAILVELVRLVVRRIARNDE
jgi:glycosyltransferase involved in cell wall biosynthesis